MTSPIGAEYVTRQKPLYQVLATKLAWEPPAGSDFVQQRHDEIRRLLALLPSGSGWDLGTKLADESGPDRIVLYGEWHHMNDGGYYDGWTAHQIIVTASLANGFTLRITGRNRNDIKDYLHETFDYALRQMTDEWSAPRA